MAPRLIFAVFVVLQAADGWLTYEAVDLFGASAEGNPILKTWMHVAGFGPALLAAKAMAIGCGAVLYATGVYLILGGLTALYLFGAVVPWLRVFSSLAA
jgi:hypothetical protein